MPHILDPSPAKSDSNRMNKRESVAFSSYFPQKLPSTSSSPSPQKVPHVLTPGEICSVCSINNSQYTCLCAWPWKLYCGECLAKHKADEPWQKHIDVAARYVECFKSMEDVSAFEARSQNVRELDLRKRRILTDIDTAKRAVAEQINALIDTLQSVKKAKAKELDLIKESVEQQFGQALIELRSTIYHRQPQSDFPLVKDIWETDLSESAFPSFSYSVTFESLAAGIQDRAIFTMDSPCDNLHFQESLYYFKENQLLRYDCNFESLQEPLTLSQDIHVSEGTSLVYAGRKRVFACGGIEPFSNSFLAIDCANGHVSQLADLKEPKGWVGVVEYHSEVYIFGGSTKSKSNTKYCEKYSQADNTWSPLPGLIHPRSAFFPCVHAGSVYIAGGVECGNLPIEIFDLRAQTFSETDFKVNNADCSVLLHRSTDFVLIQTRKYYEISLTAELHVSNPKETMVVSSNVPFVPLAKGNEYYFLDATLKVGVIRLDSMTFRL